jgi:tRNA G18 (ribose-2'-O)-methylase SpoU
VLRRAHAHVRIPMTETTDSLNVAAATAILLYSRAHQAAG